MKKAIILLLCVYVILFCVSCNKAADTQISQTDDSSSSEQALALQSENNSASAEKDFNEKDFNFKEKSSVSFKPGIYLAKSSSGEMTYYFFNNDGSSGCTSSLKSATGIAFDYVIDGENAIFYLGSVNYPRPVFIKETVDNTIVIIWENGAQTEELTYISDKSVEEFSFYSDEELLDMAVNYYETNTGISPVSSEIKSLDEKNAEICLYSNDNSETATVYTVDRFTAKATNNKTNESIDLMKH